ncbi:MAG: hypothetical protein ACOC0Z_01175 [Halohasta sp.]
MNRRAKSSLLWGVAGALLFVVLAQGYLLAVDSLPTGYPGMLGIGVAVGGIVGTVSYLAEPWLASKGRT